MRLTKKQIAMLDELLLSGTIQTGGGKWKTYQSLFDNGLIETVVPKQGVGWDVFTEKGVQVLESLTKKEAVKP
jgi:hypothetical protein